MSKTAPKNVTVQSVSDPDFKPIDNQRVEGDTLSVGQVPLGEYNVNISGDRYGDQGLKINVQSDTNQTIALTPKAATLSLKPASGNYGLGKYTVKVTDNERNIYYNFDDPKGADMKIKGLPRANYRLELISTAYHSLSETNFTLIADRTVTLRP